MHTGEFLTEAAKICRSIDARKIEQLAAELAALRERGGRLFILGAGGSAGNASHAVNDFRKLCHIECYAPVDNVAELTARTNDEGWETVFAGWLEVSRLGATDALLIFSVGGGDAERQVSVNLIRAIDHGSRAGRPRFRRRREGGRLHRSEGRCRGRDPAARATLGDAVVRGVSSGGLALPGQPSRPAAADDEMVSAVAEPLASRSAVFLDRDGVIVVPEFRDGRSYAPTTTEAFRLYDSAAHDLGRLKDAGYLLVVVTNQPDVGRGIIAPDTLEAMHRRLAAELPIDMIRTCIHDGKDGCACRKPKPGMLLAAAELLNIDFGASFMVGDRGERYRSRSYRRVPYGIHRSWL